MAIAHWVGELGVGELAALGAALLWTVASLIYSRVGQTVPPAQLNLLKGGMAIVLLSATFLVQLWLSRSPSLPDANGITGLAISWQAMSWKNAWYLGLSGAVGIGLGDTFFFWTLKLWGARRALLIETLAPPLGAFLAWIWLGEVLSLGDFTGMLLTLVGVGWVITERVPDAQASADGQTLSRTNLDQSQQSTQSWRWGLVYGLLFVVGQASGAVLSRAALAHTTVNPLVSTLVRLSAGAGVMGLWLLWQRQPSTWHWLGRDGSKQGWKILGTIAISAFLGTYLAIWLQQTALKYTATGIAQALSTTGPLFALGITYCLGEGVSGRTIVGVALALLGIILLFQ
jgi:drug/metabolite transporter (DMT)-like permease